MRYVPFGKPSRSPWVMAIVSLGCMAALPAFVAVHYLGVDLGGSADDLYGAAVVELGVVLATAAVAWSHRLGELRFRPIVGDTSHSVAIFGLIGLALTCAAGVKQWLEYDASVWVPFAVMTLGSAVLIHGLIVEADHARWRRCIFFGVPLWGAAVLCAPLLLVIGLPTMLAGDRRHAGRRSPDSDAVILRSP